MSNSNNELEEITKLLQNQNLTIENLENELNLLKSNMKNQSDDANAQLVKKLNTENDKLKYRINILKQSIADASNQSVAATPTPGICNIFIKA